MKKKVYAINGKSIFENWLLNLELAMHWNWLGVYLELNWDKQNCCLNWLDKLNGFNFMI